MSGGKLQRHAKANNTVLCKAYIDDDLTRKGKKYLTNIQNISGVEREEGDANGERNGSF